MVDGEPAEGNNLFPKRPGEKLRDARIAQGLELADVAARTRIPQRHLESIEAGNYAALPSTTYALGFAKAYARAIGADEVLIANEVRGELAVQPATHSVMIPAYEIDDTSRTPSRRLVWGGVIVFLLVVLGVYLFYGTSLFRGTGTPAAAPTEAATSEQSTPSPTATAVVPAPAGGQVTLTATDQVWVKISDRNKQTLLMKTLAAGERYDVPPAALDPVISTGRADQLTVMVNGSAVPALGSGKVSIRDVPISATALLARANPAPAAQPTSAPTPSPSRSPSALPPAFAPLGEPLPGNEQ